MMMTIELWLALLPWFICLFVIFKFRYLTFFLINIANRMNEILKEAGMTPPTPAPASVAVSNLETKRERLLCVVASGQSKLFLGKDYSIDVVKKWNEKNVNLAFQIYETKFSSLVSENIMDNILDLTSKGLSYVAPVDSSQQLSVDLKKDFIVNSELRKVTGWVAYNFGPALAILSGGLITAKHLEWEKIFPNYIVKEKRDGGQNRGHYVDWEGDAGDFTCSSPSQTDRKNNTAEETPRTSCVREEIGRVESAKQKEETGEAGGNGDRDSPGLSDRVSAAVTIY